MYLYGACPSSLELAEPALLGSFSGDGAARARRSWSDCTRAAIRLVPFSAQRVPPPIILDSAEYFLGLAESLLQCTLLVTSLHLCLACIQSKPLTAWLLPAGCRGRGGPKPACHQTSAPAVALRGVSRRRCPGGTRARDWSTCTPLQHPQQRCNGTADVLMCRC